jgi:TatD DNase family protein
MYLGVYNGKKAHEPDLLHVLSRAHDAGLDKIIVTAGSLADVKAAVALTKQHARTSCLLN